MLTQTAVCVAPLFARRDCGDPHTRTCTFLMCPDVLLSAADVNVKWGRRGDPLFWWYECSVNKHSYHCVCVRVCVWMDAVVSWSHQNNQMTVPLDNEIFIWLPPSQLCSQLYLSHTHTHTRAERDLLTLCTHVSPFRLILVKWTRPRTCGRWSWGTWLSFR